MEEKPKVRSFEDLFCWQLSRELTNKIYEATRDKNKFRDWSLANQIQRAAVSIMSNIAEGFERGTREEQIHFYYIAKASCGEVRCQLYIAFDQKYISESELDNLINLSKRTSAAIYRFIESIKVSKYKGLKFRTDKQREQEKNEIEFLREFYNKPELKHFIPEKYRNKI